MNNLYIHTVIRNVEGDNNSSQECATLCVIVLEYASILCPSIYQAECNDIEPHENDT